MRWHDNVLDLSGRKAAVALVKVVGQDFYLAGGTGLALQIGHRISLDLDMFSQKNLLAGTRRLNLVRSLDECRDVKIYENKDGTVHLALGGTAVSLFHYPYKLLSKPLHWQGLAIASMEDIAAMKLSAVIGRGSKKDFVDLYFMSKKMGLDEMLCRAAAKFSDHVDFPLQALKALMYFEDAEKEPMPKMLADITWNKVKLYFERESVRLARKFISK